ncbi:MAG: hypothetical protein ACK41F_10105 [Fimbriimonadaceae bacterium]
MPRIRFVRLLQLDESVREDCDSMALGKDPNQDAEVQDALFKEFQAYVRAIYEEAVSRTTSRLEESCNKIVHDLDAGVVQSLSAVQGKSTEFARVLEQARDGVHQMLEPTLQAFRQQLMADQVQFIDLLAGKVLAKMVELHRVTTESIDQHFRAISDEIDDGFEQQSESLGELAETTNQRLVEARGTLQAELSPLRKEIETASLNTVTRLESSLTALAEVSRQSIQTSASRLDQMLVERTDRLEKYLMGAVAGIFIALLLIVLQFLGVR